MTARGMVSFEVALDEALHAGLWILVYGEFNRDSASWPRIAKIGDRLLASWKRRRKAAPSSGRITLTLPRGEARWLGLHIPPGSTILTVDEDPIQRDARTLGQEALWAIRRRPGHPRLPLEKIRKGEKWDGKEPSARTRHRNNARLRKLETAEKERRERLARDERFSKIVASLLVET